MQATLGAIDLTAGAPSKGNYLAISRTSPTVTVEQTMGGTQIARVDPDRTGTVQVSQMLGAPANDSLSALVAQTETSGRAVSKPLLIKDYNGTTVYEMPEGCVVGYPAESMAADGTPVRVWTIAGVLRAVVGGQTNV